MNERKIAENIILNFKKHLSEQEKCPSTIEKYIRDVRAFSAFAERKTITKETVILYKKHLQKNYAVRSVNSMLASVNSLFAFLGWHDLKVKSLKLQQQVFCPEEKELTKAEYYRLCMAAKHKRNKRLNLILQTICGTGIRVSELQYITVEAVKHGEAVVNCKAKTRTIFIVKELKQKLLRYAAEQGIKSGMIFVTRTGKPIIRKRFFRITYGTYSQGYFTELKRTLRSLPTFSVIQALTQLEFISFQQAQNIANEWKICT